MKKLNEKYGIIEEDFISAEIELVPAAKARDIGFDRSLVGAYGQDDRVCAYASLISILDIAEENVAPSKTVICYLADKEEIGSNGATGLESKYIEYFMSDMVVKRRESGTDHIMRKSFWNSSAISADVNACMDPMFKGVHDEQNAGRCGYGIILTKFTGHGGKYGSNDADAEFVAEIREIFNKNKIIWQAAELGKLS